MPVYASLAALVARFREDELIQLTDDAGVGEVDQGRIDQALTSADGIIDAHLASAYQLPLARIPEVLVDIACDIARFRLYRDAPPELVDKNYRTALEGLTKIAKGLMKIDAGMIEQSARDGAVLVGDADAVFTRDRMQGY
jgi:phage gp36-like protein